MIYEVYNWDIEKNNMFYNEHTECDKFIVLKAFVDAYINNDVSLIVPYITNPIHYTLKYDRREDVDKDEFVSFLSAEIRDLHSYGKVKATIIPTSLKYKFNYADILINSNWPMEGFKAMKLYVDTFLNSVYHIWITY